MSIAYLNGEFLPLSQAQISPLDRGFLFGEGIYEVIPSYSKKIVGFKQHMERLHSGLKSLNIELHMSLEDWQSLLKELLESNEGDNLGLYIHVTRGAADKRYHGYDNKTQPTVFLMTFEITAPMPLKVKKPKSYKVISQQDQRWNRCHIKSTALLGNVLHFQEAYEKGFDETILYNQYQQLTEASSSNVFIVKNGVISTPPLDEQLLPGITRNLLVEILKKYSDLKVEERVIDMKEVYKADEVWLTSSTKEVSPVVELDGKAVGDGKVGDVWRIVQPLYAQYKFDV